MSHRWDGPPAKGPGRAAAVLSAVAVAVAAVLLLTLPAAPRTHAADVAESEQPVSSAVLGCPPGASDGVLKIASAAGLPAPAPAGGKGDVHVHGPGPDRTVTVDRGAATQVDVGGSDSVLRAADDAAIGLLAARGERVDGTLAAVGCRAPQPEWWFTGAGGGVDHASVLYLTNTDEGPATVDIEVHGATGNVDRAGTRGMTVAPGQTVRLPLADVAPGSDELTVEVIASRGRVVAAALDTVRGPDGEAREWLPPSAPPGEDVVLAGVPAGADRAELLVTNPGDAQALVDLQVVTDDGAFVPLGDEQVSVKPDSVARVDLTKALKGRAAAVHLRSEVPVTGTVRSTDAGDTAYAFVAEPLGSPAGVLLVGERSELQLVTGKAPVSVEVLAYGATGHEELRKPVTVPASGMVRVPLPAGSAYAVVVPPAGRALSGPLHVAVTHTGPGVAVQPATPLPTTLRRPAVLPWTGATGPQSAS